MDHNTTVAVNDLPTNLTAIRASQENNHSRDLARLTTTANRPTESLLRFFGHSRNDERCPNRPRSDSIDADTLAHPLVAKAVCESGDGALCARVVEQVWTADVGVDAGVVDNSVAFGHVWEGVF